MKQLFSALILLLILTQTAWAQTFAIKGKLVDKVSGEGLAGASVQVKNAEINTGNLTEVNGTFKIENLKSGSYTVTASYIGYVLQTETVVISGKDAFVTFKLGEDNSTLKEVEILADVAVERETPVAFSAIKESTIKESLAGRDLPLILNETPGVYANSGGGGAGDAEVSIRGFSANNVAVMVNGVPVNDMENGRVYWSNWDLGDVTKSMQVQRGLSASKLATPSVGGTLNVLTRGFEAKKGVIARQEIGSNNYTKTSLMLSSGKLKNDWAFTVYGSRRKGDGWVEGTFDNAYTYFANISKRFGNHTLSLTGLGSPQDHGQRSYHGSLYTIKDFSAEKAKELGAAVPVDANGNPSGNHGFNYNADYGQIDKYTIANDDTTHNKSNYNSQQNFYHKPQFNLNHFWAVSEKLFVSNVLYASIGNGGGSYLAGTIPNIDNRTDFQTIYDRNYKNKLSSSILRSSMNNHRWYGFISGLDYKTTEKTTLSLGIDGRTYKAEHFVEVTDLLGGDYVSMKSIGINSSTNANIDLNKTLQKGDRYGNIYDGIVKYIGGFAMAEYKSNVVSAFLSGTVSTTYYNRINYARAKKYTVDGNDVDMVYNNLYSINNVNYTPADYTVVARKKALSGEPKDTTLMLNNSNPLVYNGKSYQQVTDGKVVESDPVKKLGYSIKGGMNYNLNEFNNIFLNAGYISRAPFIDFIFTQSLGEKILNPLNENVLSLELGYGINRGNFKANLNAYHTTWLNKSTTTSAPKPSGEQGTVTYNVSGLNARHIGVELEIAQQISRKFELNAAISLGDWRWTSSGTARGYDENGEELPSLKINAEGVHVGGSAQNQFMTGVRFEPIKGLYIRPTYTLFAKNYATFDPKNLSSALPQDSYRLPTSHNVDIHTGYTFKFYREFKFTINGSVLNALNKFYIMNVNSGSNPYSPDDIQVFFNRGRTYNLGASVSF
jgi:iron complex outermembrane receptor protein